MKYIVSTTYVLKWQIKNAEHYKLTKDGICINTQTGKIIKQIINGRSKGYCIKGKFKSINTLRKELELIPKESCPF
jgi:hypothetical protein